MEKRKTKINIILIIVLVILLILSTGIITVKYLIDNNMIVTMKATVVRVDETGLCVLAKEEPQNGLYTLGFGKEGNIGFKQGQEILIYYDGIVLATYPGRFSHVGKIKILKQESDITIPDEILKQCYNSRDNVSVTIDEITNMKMIMTVIDNNELPYEYSENYIIYKKTKNENYTGKGYQIGEATQNSLPGFTRNGK